MSREIKYRVWDNENKSYDDPYSYAYYAMTQDGGLDFYCHGDCMDEADPDVYFIEQYTGLTDKNGIEIYEGDIVDIELHFRTGNEYIKGIVGFDYGCFSVKTIMDGYIHPLHLFTSNARASVIGNIHENKELLGEKE